MTPMTIPPATESQLYAPLSVKHKEIRLLRIASYDADDVFSICHCAMFTVSLAHQPRPRYNAFSYEWNYGVDVPEIDEAVMVNGHRIEVTRNLAALLTRFRNIAQAVPNSEMFQLPIWIDALCIDQSNVDERTVQVGLMGAIYSRAQATFTYLGEDENDSDYAMPILAEIGSKILQTMKTDDMAWVKPDEQPELWQSDQAEGGGFLNRFWTSAGAIMKRSYWRRAWIVQEILLQNNVIVFCGKNIIHYHQLNAVYYWLRRIQGRPCPPLVSVELWRLLSTKVGWYSMGWNRFVQRRRVTPSEETKGDQDAASRKEQHLQWKAWILSTVDQQATDPRDHLYSVLGLVGIGLLQPNYSASVETVFYDFATTSIEVEESLGILSYAGHWELPPTDVDNKTLPMHLFVPSWVPNWDQISKMYNFTWLLSATDQADKGWTSIHVPINGNVPWLIDGKFLISQGISFDTVSQIELCDVGDGSWLSFCLEYMNARGGQPYPDGIPALQALARLVLRGRKFASNEILERASDVETTLLSVIPAMLATFYTGNNTSAAAEIKQAEEKLGISTPDGIAEKFIGRPLSAVAQQLVGALPRLTSRTQELTRSLESDRNFDPLVPDSMNYRNGVSSGMRDHAAFVTRKGYIGWGRKGLQDGDCVCVLAGCPVPLLLREMNGYNINLGPCYVEGLMHGEAAVAVADNMARIDTLHIV
ncbi:unnamed protein product [Clonostachys rosea f. rosea IK726]|uniref:Heterokaryon incompatibility domain-containing protein n=2 Tax=Bionectria ochroleuca TaxID=29856 RepID=A0A0B7KII7_BIOOC|nr:unnamed protein product [Clonostachys rosea f. rosea IK726]